MEPASAAIAVDDLVVIRGGKRVLDGISLDVPRGVITGLLGPSGSGKTTLMRAIVGVQAIASGSVRALSLRAGSSELRSRVGYVTQAPAIYGDLTVRENLAFFRRILGAPATSTGEALETVGLTAYAGRMAGSLSGGERARVSLATAMLNSPELLVLDEPTVGLDPVLRNQLWNTFRSLAAGGVTLLVSSHVMDEAERCDRLVLLRDGRVLASDALSAILASTGAATAEQAFLSLVETEPAP